MRGEASLHPHQCAANARGGQFPGRRVRGALVEGHDDVGPQSILNFHGAFGGEIHCVAVDFVRETDSSVVDLSARKRKDLKAAAVCQNRPGPLHEGMQPAQLFDQSLAGAQGQMIGVGENDLGTRGLHLVRGHRLDGTVGADRHEGRRLDGAMGRVESPGASLAGGCFERVVKGHAGKLAGGELFSGC